MTDALGPLPRPAAGPAVAGWASPALRHGARLAVAVVVAFGVSSTLHLPESFWAVMSALIVVRPNTGSTLGAGWDRVRGTMLGTALGLGGVWIHHAVDVDAAWSTLAIVATLAFGSALVPALRSAPISALIVLTSGGVAGHDALQVASLRAVEIAIGVATGIAVSLLALAAHARAQFDADLATWLTDAAARVRSDLLDPPRDAAARDARADAVRRTIRALTVLAIDADRETTLLARLRRDAGDRSSRIRRARLVARLSGDLVALTRTVACAPMALADDARRRLADAIERALSGAADAVRAGDAAPGRRTSLAALKACSGDDAPSPWIAPAARLLLEDVAALHRLHGRRDDDRDEPVAPETR